MTFMDALISRIEFGKPGDFSELTLIEPVELSQDMKGRLLAAATKIDQSSSRA